MAPSQLGISKACPDAAAKAPSFVPLNGELSWNLAAFSGNGDGGMALVICTEDMFFCRATLTASAMRPAPISGPALMS